MDGRRNMGRRNMTSATSALYPTTSSFGFIWFTPMQQVISFITL
jgi:hypothetical protein